MSGNRLAISMQRRVLAFSAVALLPSLALMFLTSVSTHFLEPDLNASLLVPSAVIPAPIDIDHLPSATLKMNEALALLACFIP